MKEFKISIIIPIYNSERYLSECLDSIVNQTYKNIEIICINDGSPDNSIRILDLYGRQDSRIRVVTQKNKGLSGAYNRGIVESTGEYIIFVDADDWMDLDCCEVALKKSIKYSADVVLWPYIKEFKDHSKVNTMFGDFTYFSQKEVKQKLHRRLFGLLDEELMYPENSDSIVTAWGKLYKSHLLKNKNTRFVDTKLIGTEDAWFNINVFKSVSSAVFTNEIFYHYRKYNDESFTTRYRPKLFIQWQHLYELMEDFIKDNNLDSTYRSALDNRIVLSIIGLGLNILADTSSPLEKIRLIKQVVYSDQYQKIYKKFSLRWLPIHWKIFFWLVKKKYITLIYLILNVIKVRVGR
jgi:glycosyltransferase involved in cell wall biosynthesis